jgi:competence protein ComEC
MRDPLILPCAAIATGILLDRLFEFSVFEGAWTAAALTALAVVSEIAAKQRGTEESGNSGTPHRNRITRVCVTLAFVSIGILDGAWRRPGPAPEVDAGAREVVLLEGCVVEPPAWSRDREQFTLELAPGMRARVILPIDDDHPPQRLNYGERVEIEARIRAPRNFRNPGAFDYAGYLARQHIFWTAAMTRGSAARRLPGRCGSRALAVLFAIRGTALDRIEALYRGDDYRTGMMSAILIGDTARLEKIWTEDFRRTGTFHTLVISGAHVAVLAGVLLFLLRMCALPEIPSLALAALVAWLYAMISGFSPPAGRAAGGFTLYLAARFFFRKGRVLNLLAAVAIVYLLCDPAELFDASFQLSFLSVAAMGAIAIPVLEATTAPLARSCRGIMNVDADPHLEPRAAQFRVELRLAAETVHLWTRLPACFCALMLALMARAAFFAFEIFTISLCIQVGLALPMAEYFHRFSFTGLSANLIIVPALEVAVPLGFFAVFTGWKWASAFAGWLLTLSARTAEWHARLEPSWRISNPPLGIAVAFAAALVLLAWSLRHGRLRFAAGLAAGAIFVLLLLQPWPAATLPGTLELTAVDVGQGDSLLVVFPQGRRMIIDGGGVLPFGPHTRKPNLDTGEDVVSPYLWTRGIRRIDVLVATHAHEDHAGGLIALLENFQPSEIWVGANPPAALAERAAALNVPMRPMRTAAPFDYSGAKIEVLSPPPDYTAAKPGNNDSLALRLTYGIRSFVLTGDMEWPMEARLLADGRVSHADVLKVGHHGSKTSTSQEFLDAISPEFAVISAGFQNSFGHPHRDVLARLAAKHAAVYRTDRDGLITLRTDGRRLWTESPDTGPPLGGFSWEAAGR